MVMVWAETGPGPRAMVSTTARRQPAINCRTPVALWVGFFGRRSPWVHSIVGVSGGQHAPAARVGRPVGHLVNPGSRSTVRSDEGTEALSAVSSVSATWHLGGRRLPFRDDGAEDGNPEEIGRAGVDELESDLEPTRAFQLDAQDVRLDPGSRFASHQADRGRRPATGVVPW